LSPVFFTVIREHAGFLYFVTQNGVIFRQNITTLAEETFIDISSRVDYAGDERGLLGFDFGISGRFYIWFTEKGPTGPPPPSVGLDACVPATLNQSWNNRNTNFTNVNRLEEWAIIGGLPQRQRTMFRMSNPFINHNGSNNVVYDKDINKLILATGDGGSGLDPFNLAQNDNELHGKLISIDVNNSFWNGRGNTTVTTQVSQLGIFAQVIKVISKGIRNPSGLAHKPQVNLMSMAGQSTVEPGFAFQSYDKNFGWRPFEGTIPSVLIRTCTNSNRESDVAFVSEFLKLQNDNTAWRPIVAYANGSASNLPLNIITGSAMTGLELYRGTIPGLNGHLLVADLSGKLLHAPYPDPLNENELQLLQTVERITVNGFGGPISTLFVTSDNRILIGTNGSIFEITS